MIQLHKTGLSSTGFNYFNKEGEYLLAKPKGLPNSGQSKQQCLIHIILNIGGKCDFFFFSQHFPPLSPHWSEYIPLLKLEPFISFGS